MRLSSIALSIATGWLAGLPLVSNAHHSFAATFDAETVSEVVGEVTSVKWSNPHVLFTLEATDEHGQTVAYEIESHSLSLMRRMEIPSDAIRVGDTIRLAGNPARQSATRFFALNALLPDGREVVFDPWTEPRWAENVGTKEGVQATPVETSDQQSRIFRVWSTSLSDPAVFPFPETIDPSYLSNYPLTEFAREALAVFDPETDTPTLNCAPKGMPAIMEQPYPMEFVDQGETILMRLEEYDTLRTIHMDGARESANREPTILGYSTGRWEESTLVVETTDVNWGYFDTVGIPLTDRAHIAEWFIPSEDGLRLDYRMNVTDPAIFIETVELTKYWLALDGIQVQPYECTD